MPPQQNIIPVIPNNMDLDSNTKEEVVQSDDCDHPTVNSGASKSVVAIPEARKYRPSDPPVLPNGREIDAKNTLQTITTTAAIATTPAPQNRHFPPPMLKNGQEINAKNTLGEVDSTRVASTGQRRNNPSSVMDDTTELTGATTDQVFAHACIIDERQSTSTVLLPVQRIASTAISNSADLVSQQQRRKQQYDAENLQWTAERPARRYCCPTFPKKWLLAIILVLIVLLVAGGTTAGVCLSSSRCSTTKVAAVETSTIENVSTQAPSSPFNARAVQLEPFINIITLSNKTLVYTPSTTTTTASLTPEELALRWLIEADMLQLVPDSPSNQFRIVQRYALQTLWAQQPAGDTGDPSRWSTDMSTVDDPDECQWQGITCTTMSLIDNTTDTGVRMQTVVTQWDLTWNSLEGVIATDIGLLSHLVFFDVYGNNLGGTLPYTIGKWSHLETFILDENSFIGSLPESIGAWSNLLHCSVEDNELTGTLPSTVGQWTSLEKIELTGNMFRGAIPESIGNWTSIKVAPFFYNNFTGSMPDEICQADDLAQLWADCDDNVVYCPCCGQCF